MPPELNRNALQAILSNIGELDRSLADLPLDALETLYTRSGAYLLDRLTIKDQELLEMYQVSQIQEQEERRKEMFE